MPENYYPATRRDKQGRALAFSTTSDRVFNPATGVSVKAEMGEVSSLSTTAKTVVPAINENKASIDTLNQNLAVGGYTANSAVVTVVNGMSAFECGNKICILSFNLLISAPAGTSALITGLPKNADSSGTTAICFFGGGVTTIKMSGTTLYLNYLNTASTGNIFGQIVYPI